MTRKEVAFLSLRPSCSSQRTPATLILVVVVAALVMPGQRSASVHLLGGSSGGLAVAASTYVRTGCNINAGVDASSSSGVGK